MQIINPVAELIIPIAIPTKEQKSERETHPEVLEITISNWSI